MDEDAVALKEVGKAKMPDHWVYEELPDAVALADAAMAAPFPQKPYKLVMCE